MVQKKVKISEVKVNHYNTTPIVCNSCGGVFTSRKNCKTRTPKYCTKKCYVLSLVKERSEKPKRISRKGITLSEEWKAALSLGRKNSDKCKGENLYNWKGGKETERLRIKASMYKRKLSLKKTFDQLYLSRLLVTQNNRCFFCESSLSDYKAIEHLTPVTRGGDNDNYNLVYSCKSCNSKKRQNTLEEFAIKNLRFDWIDKFDYIYATTVN